MLDNQEPKELEERPYPHLLSEAETNSLLLKAENLWSALKENKLGGFSGINRPFFILNEFKEIIEEYGCRDVGLTWSYNDLQKSKTLREQKVEGLSGTLLQCPVCKGDVMEFIRDYEESIIECQKCNTIWDIATLWNRQIKNQLDAQKEKNLIKEQQDVIENLNNSCDSFMKEIGEKTFLMKNQAKQLTTTEQALNKQMEINRELIEYKRHFETRLSEGVLLSNDEYAAECKERIYLKKQVIIRKQALDTLKKELIASNKGAALNAKINSLLIDDKKALKQALDIAVEALKEIAQYDSASGHECIGDAYNHFMEVAETALASIKE